MMHDAKGRRFRYKPQVHLALLFIIAIMVYFAGGSLATTQSIASGVIYIICFIVFAAAVIDSIFTAYHVHDEGLLLKSLLKSTFIKWNDVEEISKQSGASLVTETIGIISKHDKISITRWTKDYRELLSLVLDECKSNDNIKIDFRVMNIVNKCRKK